MKRVSWKYLAGLIDGEGCIDLQCDSTRHREGYRLYARPRLRMAMAESAQSLLEMIQANYGGGIYARGLSQGNPMWQNAVSWELAGYKQVCPVLRNIVNHLFLKREQARLLLWMEEHVKGRHLGQKAIDLIRAELKLMKRDPHRLSETAQTLVWEAIVGESEADPHFGVASDSGDGRNLCGTQGESRSRLARS